MAMRNVFTLALLPALWATGLAAQEVGVTAAVNQSAVGTAPAAAPRTLVIGDSIIHDEKIVTDGNGLLQILLADGTSFTVGPNSSLVIDSFVYDPQANTAKVAATLGAGLFRFIGGQASKSPDGVTLNTPVGTVGIQGGIANLDFSGAGFKHIDLLYGVQATLKDGTQVIGNVYQSGYSIVIGTDGKVSVEKTPPEWAATFQQAMAGNGSGGKAVPGDKVAGLRGGNNGNGNPPADPGNRRNDENQSDLLVATWDQLENSEAIFGEGPSSGTVLYYDGSFVGTYSDSNEGYYTGEGNFWLNWYTDYRSGDAGFNVDGSPDVFIAVAGDTGAGGSSPATFGIDSLYYSDSYYSIDGVLNGFFFNTAQGNGTGVAGTVDVTLNDGEVTQALTGAFAGTHSDTEYGE